MNAKLTIQERLKDLRVNDRQLTLEQLAEATGLSRSALGNYESNDFKDISPFSIATLAQFYGVSTDYLLGLTEQKNHPDAEVLDLHLSDEMLEILRSSKINNRLLCEIVTHREFCRLLADIEIYVDRIASAQINNLNAWVSVARAEILARQQPDEEDIYLRTLEAAYIQEDKYFTYAVHEDMDAIIADIREAHKKDVTTADDGTVAAKLKQDVEDAMQFEGSDQERLLQIFCKQLDAPYGKLTQEESAGVISLLRKSKELQVALNKRGRTKGRRSREGLE